jgi:hypothetical protein
MQDQFQLAAAVCIGSRNIDSHSGAAGIPAGRVGEMLSPEAGSF